MKQEGEYTVEDILGSMRTAWNSIREEARHIEDSRYMDRMAELKARLKAAKAEFQKIGE